MKNLTLALIIIITLISRCVHPGFLEQEKSLTRAMEEYIDCNNNKDIACLMSFYPENVLTTTELEAELVAFSENKESTINQVDTIFAIDTLISKNETYYGRIQSQLILMNDLSEFKEENGATFAVSASILAQEHQYGKENVKFDTVTWLMQTHLPSYHYGFMPITSDEWKIFSLTPFTAPFVPDEIK